MKWNANLAYVIGLIATDGSLSKDQRHIIFTSKDLDQIQNFAKLLRLKSKVDNQIGTYNPKKIYYRLQFSNVKLYRFLNSIGISSNKTKSIGKLKISDKYFRDFLRGHLDGDGFTYSYWDKRWKSSFMLYLTFVSASLLILSGCNSKLKNYIRKKE